MLKEELTDMIYTSSNTDLRKFLQKEYSFHGAKYIKDKIELVNNLDKSTLEYGITRMKAIEETLDISKVLAPFVVMIMAIITGYNAVFVSILKNDNSNISNWLNVVSILVIFAVISYFVGKNNSNRASVIYFLNLLEFALENNNENKK